MSKVALAILLLCLNAVGCAAAAPTPAPEAPPMSSAPTPSKSGKIRYVDNPNLDVKEVPALIALDALQAQGYTVERQSLATTSLIADALARGNADIATSNTQVMWTAIVKGADVRTFIAKMGSTLTVESKQEIKTCGDLKDQTIGVAATTGTNPMLLNLYIEKNCPSVKPKLAVIPDNTSRVAALMAGQIDAALLQSEQLVQLERDAPGRFHTLVPLYKEFPKVQINALHVRRDWAEQNPELVKDFVRALLAANRRVYAEPQVLYAESVRRLGLDPAVAKEVADSYLAAGLWDVNGGLTLENVQYTVDFFTNINALPEGLKAEDVADLSYLNAVLDEIGRK